MSRLSQFLSRPRSVASHVTQAGTYTPALPGAIYGAKKTNVSCPSDGTLQTLLSVTGAGALKFVAAKTMTNAVAAVRTKITIDGVVAYDETTSNTTATSQGLLSVGGITYEGTTAYTVVPDRLHYNTSLLIEVGSVSGSTNTVACHYLYEVHQ